MCNLLILESSKSLKGVVGICLQRDGLFTKNTIGADSVQLLM